MVLSGGELVYLILKGAEDELFPICGWTVELIDDEVVVGTAVSAVSSQIPGAVEGKSGSEKLLFLRVPKASVSTTQPSEWKGNPPSSLPAWTSALALWRKVDSKNLGSSEAEVPRPKPARAPSKKGAAAGDERFVPTFRGRHRQRRGRRGCRAGLPGSSKQQCSSVAPRGHLAGSQSRGLPRGSPGKGHRTSGACWPRASRKDRVLQRCCPWPCWRW